MVVREWRARAEASRGGAYPQHFRTQVLPELSHISGFLGAELMRRERDGGLEFVVLTRWESLDAVRAFAGGDIGKAVVEPGAVAALTAFDTHVSHYEVVESAPA